MNSIPSSIEQVIRDRRTIHDFKSTPVAREILIESLELSLWSLNHKLTLPWTYYEFTAEQRRTLSDWFIAAKAKKKPLFAQPGPARDQEIQKFLDIPHVFCILQPMPPEPNPNLEQEDYAAIACGVQNLSLYLWTKGVGSKWSTGSVARDPKLLALMELDPVAWASRGFLFVGYPERVPQRTPRLLRESPSQMFHGREISSQTCAGHRDGP